MLKFYEYSKLKKEEKNNILLEKIYNVTKCLEKDYPNHYNWFYNKFVKELDGEKREIIYCVLNEKIVGVVFLKNTMEEKKICTIYIDDKYRNKGIGTILLEKSFDFLGTNKPLITMPSYKEKCFEKIINKYKWIKIQTINYYYSNNKEIVFNQNLI